MILFQLCAYFLNMRITHEINFLIIPVGDEVTYGLYSGGKIVLNYKVICLFPSLTRHFLNLTA